MDYKKLVKEELSKIECGEFSKIEDVRLISDLGIDIMTNIVKKLTIPDVVERSEQLLLDECPNKGDDFACGNGGICPDCS